MYTAAIILLGIVPPALMFLFATSRAEKGELHPLTVLGFALLFGYTLKSLYLAYAVNTDAPFRTRDLSLDIVTLGQMAIGVGLVAFLIGFVLAHRGTAGAPAAPLQPRRPRLQNPEYIYFPLFILSVLLMVIYFYQMGFLTQVLTLQFTATKWYVDEEGIRNTLGFLVIGADFIVVFFLYFVAMARKIHWSSYYLWAIGFISICYLLASRRNGVLIIIASFLMVVGIRKIKMTAATKLTRNALIVGALLLVAIAGFIRQGGGSKSIEDISIASSIAVTAENLFEGAYFLDPAKTATIIDQTERRNLYLNGQSFAAVIFAPIPRIMWSEKPNIRIGPYVGQEVIKLKSQSGAPPGGIGELYLNFGWPGILVGMALLGGLTGRLYTWYLGTPDKRFSRPLYALLLLAVMLFVISDFAFAILYVIRYSFAAFICILFWEKIVYVDHRNRQLRSPSAGNDQPALAS